MTFRQVLGGWCKLCALHSPLSAFLTFPKAGILASVSCSRQCTTPLCCLSYAVACTNNAVGTCLCFQ